MYRCTHDMPGDLRGKFLHRAVTRLSPLVSGMYGNKVIPENAQTSGDFPRWVRQKNFIGCGSGRFAIGPPNIICIYIHIIYCIYIHIQSHTFLYPQTKSWFRGLALDLLFMAWGLCFAQVRIISCCNPYRKRRNKDTTGMVKKYPWGNSNLEWRMVGEW